MRLHRCLIGFSALFLLIAVAHAREWTDSTGTRKVEGEFIELTDGIVKARMPDGTIKSIPLDKLSPADQEFARQSAAAQIMSLAPEQAVAVMDKMYDQTIFAKVALETKDELVRRHAIVNLDDKEMQEMANRIIVEIPADDPRLTQFAGDLSECTTKLLEAVARIKLALAESRIRDRISQVQIETKFENTSRSYVLIDAPFRPRFQNVSVDGQIVTIVLSPTNGAAIQRTWLPPFPNDTVNAYTDSVGAGRIHGEELLAALLASEDFSREDLVELLGAKIPEVRAGAALNLSDQALLAETASNDKAITVRVVALTNLSDQTALMKLVTEGRDDSVSRAAVRKLTDQTLLTKIALEKYEVSVRLNAIESLTDQSILAMLVHNKDISIRLCAEERLAVVRGAK